MQRALTPLGLSRHEEQNGVLGKSSNDPVGVGTTITIEAVAGLNG